LTRSVARASRPDIRRQCGRSASLPPTPGPLATGVRQSQNDDLGRLANHPPRATEPSDHALPQRHGRSGRPRANDGRCAARMPGMSKKCCNRMRRVRCARPRFRSAIERDRGVAIAFASCAGAIGDAACRRTGRQQQHLTTHRGPGMTVRAVSPKSGWSLEGTANAGSGRRSRACRT